MTFRHTIIQSNYDSVFEPAGAGRPAKLTIRLKVALYPVDPSIKVTHAGAQHPAYLADSMAEVLHRHGLIPDADGRLVKCRRWLVPEWNRFKIEFKRVVERSWNNQMFLLPPEGKDGDALSDADYRQLIGNPRIAAHVECALDIELMPATAALTRRRFDLAHAQIEVVHLAEPGHPFRQEMHLISNESTQFKAHYNAKWPGVSTYQVAAAHEVGHWLHSLAQTYFEHIDEEYANTLPPAQQDDAQYGHVLGKRVAQMGAGNLATQHEAKPWLERIARHTHALFGWTMVHRINFNNSLAPLPARQQRLVRP